MLQGMAQITKAIIYYFSGTGNSKNVVTWVTQVLNERGIEPIVVSVKETDRLSIAAPDPEAIVFFISPVHGFNYPPVMLHYIWRFPKSNNKVVLMNTRAGMLLGKVITPGLSGIAFYLAGLLLKIKGYSIKGTCPVDLPSNWLSLHPALNKRTISFLHEKNKQRVQRFTNQILDGKQVYKGKYEIIQDMLIAPVAAVYYLLGRFMIAKTFYASSACDNCGSCIKGCPVHAIKEVDHRPFWTFHCESCMKCMGNCHTRAIETSHGTFILLIYFALFLVTLFYKYADIFNIVSSNALIKNLFETIVFAGLLALWYRGMHYAMRIKFIERIVVYTSLTHYKFWGRYKALREK